VVLVSLSTHAAHKQARQVLSCNSEFQSRFRTRRHEDLAVIQHLGTYALGLDGLALRQAGCKAQQKR
jgi:hypothetical protein